ncbi:MAG TPA: hypothetical protein VIW94_06155 [Acidimicrobiia bacterium]
MIRYPILENQLRSRVEELRPGWLEKVALRTEVFRAAGEYNESSGAWSEIKSAYMDLQGFKCGFCERRLEKSVYGNVEHDVEHFRPKAKVKKWPSDSDRTERGINFQFPLGDDEDNGYYLLAYELENYLISCKTCNTRLKANYFPVSSARTVDLDRSRDLDDEKPFLVYPIGARDADPETIITFRGILPIPAASKGHLRKRGEVTIRFFELDTREVLLEERAETILRIHLAMATVGHPDPLTGQAASLTLDRIVDRRSPHANCARAFHDLWLSDNVLAREFAGAALGYLESVS